MSLVRQVERKRVELGLSVEEIADRLGISGSMYRKVRLGDRNPKSPSARKPGKEYLSGVVEEFPELAPQVWAFLLQKNGTVGPKKGQKGRDSGVDSAAA